MNHNSPKNILLWSIATMLFVGGTFCLDSVLRLQYSVSERQYSHPLGHKRTVIRNDGGGKGHFGAHRDPNRLHKGVDLASRMDDPIFAAKSGRIAMAEPNGGYGNYIEIHHPDGLESRYAHLSEIHVQKGDWVRRGTLIGRVGKTGNARGRKIEPHLHFEIRDNDKALNPIEFMKRTS